MARALSLDADRAEAHVVIGAIQKSHDWDWAAAGASFRRALTLEPRNAIAIGGAGSVAWILGNLEEAIGLYQRAIGIDPLNSNLYFYLGLVLNCAGRQEQATVALDKVLELAPERGAAHGLLARVYLMQSRPQDALAEAEKEKHPIYRLWALALAYHSLSRKKESDANLAKLIGNFQSDVAYTMGSVFAFPGETEKAFDRLESGLY